MNIKDCFQLGKFTKPFRYSGEVILWMDVDDSTPYRGVKVVWVEERKQLVPYLINKLKKHNDRFVAHVEGITSEEAAKALCGKDIYLPISELPDLGDDHFYFHEVGGWNVVDLNTGDSIGVAIQVLDHGPYPMLEVDQNGTILILPLPKNFKIEVERENKTLKVEIPEGLIDVFKNPGKNDEGEDIIFEEE
jgi:16S rRNA processing protein RimM